MNHLIGMTFYAVMSLFIYVDDAQQFPHRLDDWRSYANQVEQHQTFIDDCDSIPVTVIELLYRKKFPLDQTFICTCKTENGEHHLVGIVNGILIDSRMKVLYNWDEIDYTWYSCMSMNEVGVWRLVNQP